MNGRFGDGSDDLCDVRGRQTGTVCTPVVPVLAARAASFQGAPPVHDGQTNPDLISINTAWMVVASMLRRQLRTAAELSAPTLPALGLGGALNSNQSAASTAGTRFTYLRACPKLRLWGLRWLFGAT